MVQDPRDQLEGRVTAAGCPQPLPGDQSPVVRIVTSMQHRAIVADTRAATGACWFVTGLPCQDPAIGESERQ